MPLRNAQAENKDRNDSMLRWSIIRTLLYKEVLRYRYNWGLLVVVFALLALSALISIGARYKRLPGQTSDEYLNCVIMYHPGSTEGWIKHLKDHPPPFRAKLSYQPLRDLTRVMPDSMVIEIKGPAANTSDPTQGTWKAIYWHQDEGAPGVAPYRDWLARETRIFLGMKPVFEEMTHKGAFFGTGNIDFLPRIVTSLVIFAIYLLSFSLYITSSGEEREKRVLLGLLLTPASSVEFIAAKAIFYVSASVAVAMSVAFMYQPRLISNPLLWGAVLFGSLAYLAIGTVIISLVRRQTTINTVSMVYLMMVAIIMMLGQFLPLFYLLQLLLMENYVSAQLQNVIDEKMPWRMMAGNQVVLVFFVMIWSCIALLVFRRHATSIARSR